VRNVGTVTTAQLERHYRAADVFAFPSTKEGFGLVALEALAAGLPLVASEIDVFRTFLTHGESALLSPAGDGDALGRALARLARDRPLCERLVAGGRKVVDAYGWDTAAVAHEDAYRAFQGDPIGVLS
jgi:glycosyltransferase involved in cell wall biosynthesis